MPASDSDGSVFHVLLKYQPGGWRVEVRADDGRLLMRSSRRFPYASRARRYACDWCRQQHEAGDFAIIFGDNPTTKGDTHDREDSSRI